jgi:elongation factor G
MSFKIASRMAFKEAMKQAGPVLLEPIMELNVYADNKYVGDILSDLSSKRGKVTGEESLGGIELIKALVPQKELLRYAMDLKSITSGTASFEMNFCNYQPVAGKIADDIIAIAKKDYKEEEE